MHCTILYYTTLYTIYIIYSQPSTFISAVLLISCTMLRLALPHVNILTKVRHYIHTPPFLINMCPEISMLPVSDCDER